MKRLEPHSAILYYRCHILSNLVFHSRLRYMHRDYRKNSIFKEFTTTGLIVIGSVGIIFILLIGVFVYLFFKYK